MGAIRFPVDMFDYQLSACSHPVSRENGSEWGGEGETHLLRGIVDVRDCAVPLRGLTTLWCEIHCCGRVNLNLMEYTEHSSPKVKRKCIFGWHVLDSFAESTDRTAHTWRTLPLLTLDADVACRKAKVKVIWCSTWVSRLTSPAQVGCLFLFPPILKITILGPSTPGIPTQKQMCMCSSYDTECGEKRYPHL